MRLLFGIDPMWGVFLKETYGGKPQKKLVTNHNRRNYCVFRNAMQRLLVVMLLQSIVLH